MPRQASAPHLFIGQEGQGIVEIGLHTDSVSHLELEEALELAAELELDTVEFATGNWSNSPHVDLDALCDSAEARSALLGAVESRGLRISALNANGNQLHPRTGPEQDRVVRRTIDAAAELGVPTVVLMSGLPAGSPEDSVPNWITTSWPPENVAVLEYQWDSVTVPYWVELAETARRRGVRLAVEMHGHQLVFNVAGLLQLRAAAGDDVVGANLDPSHLMWMGADIIDATAALGDAIFHVHAKDARIESRRAAVNGVLERRPPEDAAERAWNYVTLGLGHPRGSAFWTDFAYTLRAAGYDGTLSIEHEDVLMGAKEGVRRSVELLRTAVIRDRPDWSPAQI